MCCSLFSSLCLVRTPLNAVCLGLSLLQDEMEQAATESNTNIKEPNSSEASATHPTTRQQEGLREFHTKLDGWRHLTREICDSAESSVDVLNDLLNYDKIKMGSFSMEFTVFSVWKLVEVTSREFRLSAHRKKIEFALDNQLLQGNTLGDKNDAALGDPENANGTRFDSLKIVGDWIRLTQILRNLVSVCRRVLLTIVFHFHPFSFLSNLLPSL